MSLVADEDDAAVPFGGLGGEQVAGLGHQLGFEVAGLGAERADDGDIQAPGAEGGVGDVDDLVAGGVEAGDGGAQRHGLPGADVAGDHAERGFHHAEADPGDRLGVRLAGGQGFGGGGTAGAGAFPAGGGVGGRGPWGVRGERTARRSTPGWAGGGGPPASNRQMGAWPVSACARRLATCSAQAKNRSFSASRDSMPAWVASARNASRI